MINYLFVYHNDIQILKTIEIKVKIIYTGYVYPKYDEKSLIFHLINKN